MLTFMFYLMIFWTMYATTFSMHLPSEGMNPPKQDFNEDTANNSRIFFLNSATSCTTSDANCCRRRCGIATPVCNAAGASTGANTCSIAQATAASAAGTLCKTGDVCSSCITATSGFTCATSSGCTSISGGDICAWD